MQFKILNLKKSRELLVSENAEGKSYPTRRSFMKAFGLGTLAFGPVINSLRAATMTLPEFRLKNNRLTFHRNNQVAWEISEKYFEPGYKVSIKQYDNFCTISAENLKLRAFDFDFSFKARIFNSDKTWDFNCVIPELDLKYEGNFLQWIDGIVKFQEQGRIQTDIASLNGKDRIMASGIFRISLFSDWRIELESEKGISLYSSGNKYCTNNLVIQPNNKDNEIFVNSNNLSSSKVILPEFKEWKTFIENCEFDQGKLNVDEYENPDIYISLSKRNSKMGGNFL